MKRLNFWLIFVMGIVAPLLMCSTAMGQDPRADLKAYGDKFLSGPLYQALIMAGDEADLGVKVSRRPMSVILYFREKPSAAQLRELNSLGVTCFTETWTPPVRNHPLGFLTARAQKDKLRRVLALPWIIKIDTGERTTHALNNSATRCVRAPMLWDKGWTGKGIKVGVLDSGIDISYAGSDLPAGFLSKDYSLFPDIDDDVANQATGHGTHVAATVLGRGVLSAGQSDENNGKGAFKGAAPGADLVFLKIGKDKNAIAMDEATIAAIDAAVNIYHVDILTMSYGGWEIYHDGSSALDQKVDWAYEQGVPFFCSAGNEGSSRKHVMNVISPGETTGLIPVEVKGAATDDTKLRFNLIWTQAMSTSDLRLDFYGTDRLPITSVTHMPATTSLRGTTSQISEANDYLPSGDGTYYLTITNNSTATLTWHLYEDWSSQEDMPDNVRFTIYNSEYTIGSPASADHAMAVGAYVSRTIASNTTGGWWWGNTYIYNEIAPFSSQGPTLDERMKPDITAPGHVLISLRDKDFYRAVNNYWVDNDGRPGGDANYYMMKGTSMACPIVAGAAALYLEKYPWASPQDIYTAFTKYADKTGRSGLPDNIWGAGKLDAYAAAMGNTYQFRIDGNLNEPRYETLATFTTNRNGAGDGDRIGAIKFYSDGVNLHFGVTGDVSTDKNIVLFFDFSGVKGKGDNWLGGGGSDFVFSVFSYLGNTKMDLDADFALALTKNNSDMKEFFAGAWRCGDPNQISTIGKVNQLGANSSYDIGTAFGGKGALTFAFNPYSAGSPDRGVECLIPIAAFAGVDTTQTVRLFAFISQMNGQVTNECIPGDPGPQNPGDGADFRSFPSQDFFTRAVRLSSSDPNDVEIRYRDLFSLGQAYPNPVTGMASIQYMVPPSPDNQPVQLAVYDLAGREVMKLVNQQQPEGEYTASLDGNLLESGVYYYRLQAAGRVATRKVVVVK